MATGEPRSTRSSRSSVGRGLPTIRLSVVPENEQALEFYRRNGFAETGEIHGGEIVMERQI